MRLKTVSIQNFRLIADATIDIPTGLTLVNGENGLGKSSIFQAILWCLYGPDALGDNQTSLVRQGHRDLSVVVDMVAQKEELLTISRKFSLAPNGKSGRTELTVSNPFKGGSVDYSGGTVAEAQDWINKFIGTRDIFMATAYVDQHDGPGAFLRATPAAQREQLRDMLNISDDWDQWHDLAKLKHKTVADRIVGNLGRVGAAQEFIDQNGEAQLDYDGFSYAVADFELTIKKLNLNLEDLQDAQDYADKVVAENERRVEAITASMNRLDSELDGRLFAEGNKNRLTNLIANLPALNEERRAWMAETDVWDDRSTQYQESVASYNGLLEQWRIRLDLFSEMYQYFDKLGLARFDLSGAIAYTDHLISEAPASGTHCPTCAQELKSDEAHALVNADRKKLLDDQSENKTQREMMGENTDELIEIKDDLREQDASKPVAPVSPGTRPVFESEAEWNSAKSAENDIAAVDAEIKTRTEQVDTLSLAREELPTPDEYDATAYTIRAQAINSAGYQIEQAETDKRDREHKLAAAENTLEMIEARETELTILEQHVTDDQKLQKELDVVVTGTGPNGARQLMIDQQLGDFQAETNQWLNVLLPGFAIFMDTQAESGRESFTTAFATPTGVIGWNGLSGAQRVGVGLSTRLALASMVQQRQGHTFETWIIDEADGAMHGEKREAFVAMLYKLQQQGIDLLVVSHADTVVERMEQRIEVRDAGGYTEVI